MPLPLAIPAMIAGGTALSEYPTSWRSTSSKCRQQKLQTPKKENLEYQKRLKKLRGKGRTMQYKDVPKTSRPPDCPKLASGSAAQTMAPIRTEAPQIDTQAASAGYRGMSEAAITAMNAMAQKAQIDKTFEENKLIRLQQDRQALENNFMSQSFP